MKKFFIGLFLAAIFFIAGVVVGRFVMPRKVEITVIDIKDLVDIIERYNESKAELEKMRKWNREAIIEPESKPEETEK